VIEVFASVELAAEGFGGAEAGAGRPA
jgi:hypothetical protein